MIPNGFIKCIFHCSESWFWTVWSAVLPCIWNFNARYFQKLHFLGQVCLCLMLCSDMSPCPHCPRSLAESLVWLANVLRFVTICMAEASPSCFWLIAAVRLLQSLILGSDESRLPLQRSLGLMGISIQPEWSKTPQACICASDGANSGVVSAWAHQLSCFQARVRFVFWFLFHWGYNIREHE